MKIEELEHESRLMRARMERLERENEDLKEKLSSINEWKQVMATACRINKNGTCPSKTICSKANRCMFIYPSTHPANRLGN
jgi:predicted RNase H-like nuclease (RuvC/YqgF family)